MVSFSPRYFLPGAGVEVGRADFTAEEVLAVAVAVLAAEAVAASAVAEVQEAGRMKINNNSLGAGQ